MDPAKIIRDTWDKARLHRLDFEKCPRYRVLALRPWFEQYDEWKKIDGSKPVDLDTVEFRAGRYARRGSPRRMPPGTAIEGEYQGVRVVVEEWGT